MEFEYKSYIIDDLSMRQSNGVIFYYAAGSVLFWYDSSKSFEFMHFNKAWKISASHIDYQNYSRTVWENMLLSILPPYY